MKKLILSFAIVIGLAFTANAQTEGAVNKISIGGDFLYPATGLLAESYNLGYGGSLAGEYNIYKKLNVTLSAGYLAMVYKQKVKDIYVEISPDITKNDVSYPVRAGAKYYFGKIYGAADAGVAISLDNDRNSSFIFAGGFGTSYSVSPKSSIDVGVRYEGWSSYAEANTKTTISSFVGLRAAYSFGL
jgi:hypothetical protein